MERGFYRVQALVGHALPAIANVGRVRRGQVLVADSMRWYPGWRRRRQGGQISAMGQTADLSSRSKASSAVPAVCITRSIYMRSPPIEGGVCPVAMPDRSAH